MHSRIIRRWIMLSSLILCGTSQAQDLAGACRSIIDSGLRNLSITRESVYSLQTIFRRHCEANGQVRSSSLGAGIGAVIESIPVKFTGSFSNSREAMQNFCKTFSSASELDVHLDKREETIVERAYDSFDQCIIMASRGIVVRHEVRDANTFDFFVSPGFNTVRIHGVQVPGHVQCVGVDPTRSAAPLITYGSGTRLVINGEQTLNIACTRTGTPRPDGVTDYPEATVTLLTNIVPIGNYSAYLPPDARLPRDLATEVRASLRALDASHAALAARAEANDRAVVSGRTVIGALNGNRAPFWRTDRVKFRDADGNPVEFARIPHVVAVPEKGDAQNGVSWAATVEAVTKTDFTVRIIQVGRSVEGNHGWNGAVAVAWIADGR